MDFLKQPGVDALIDGLGITRELDLRDGVSGQRGPKSLLAQQVAERHQISAYREDDMIAAVERFGQEAEWGHVRDFSRALATAPGVRAILALLADDSNRPAYVHCTLGKDRTGMICGAVLAAIGVPREAVVEDYALSKRDLDAWFVQAIAASDRARKLFESATPTALRSFKSAAPENMEKMLQGLDEQYGSPADYIRSLAGGDAILAGLRRKLVEA